jgi:hypothetical protein
LSADSAQSTAPAIDTQQSKPRVLARAEITNHSVVQLDTVKPASATATPKAKTTPLPIAKETLEGVNSAPSAPPAQRATTYEVTRSSRVYAAPSEASQALGDIEPGTKVSVVNNRDGWLEIYSKHGRPPGFIRKDTAARIVAQN